MRISHRYRFVFFANPKTGSSSMRRFLDPYTEVMPVENYLCRTPDNPFYPHMTPLEARPLFEERGWDFDGYTKFCFVRNPWARLVSLYKHVCEADCRTASFADWLCGVEPSGRGGGGEDWQRWRRYGGYSIVHFAGDGNGRLLVDRILRFEDLGQVVTTFLSSLGLPDVDRGPIPHRNRRDGLGHYTAYYTPETVALVSARYRYDVETFGYEFGR